MSLPLIGKPIDRVDGPLKVTGRATYSAEWQLPGLLHAVIVPAPIGKGRIMTLDTAKAARATGVVAVLTHLNAPRAQSMKGANFGSPAQEGGGGPETPPDASVVLQSDQVHYPGEPIALVIAETFEQATFAARLVTARFQEEAVETDLTAHLERPYAPEQIHGESPDHGRGSLTAGLREADVVVEPTYQTLAESHNPLEPHATIASWKNETLTLYDATQWVYGVRGSVAKALNLDVKQVRAVARFIGGAFGSKGVPRPHVVLAAMATLHTGRPVKLVVTRRQMFFVTGFRPHTIQRLKLGARKDGTLTLVEHHGINQTSQIGEFAEPVGNATRMLYATPNLAVTHRLVRLDTQTPTFQRAPGEASGSIGLECAMDELAYALDLDPLALRLKNYAERDEDKRVPFSSKALAECYRQGAERFGWASRPMKPGSLRQGRMRVGWGVATASYPAHRSGAMARVRISADGRALAQSASHDIGTGTYTVLTQVTALELALPVPRVTFELGDTDYPYAPVAGGSQSAASVSVVLHDVCTQLKGKFVALASRDHGSPLFGAQAEQIAASDGRLHWRDDPARGETYEAILNRHDLPYLEAEGLAKPGEEVKDYSSHAWGAQFAEVQVDPDLGMVRVTRMVGAFCGGTILNEKTARSQLMGGMVMGIGMALLEAVERDPRNGRVVNASLEKYMVPVNPDVPPMEVFFVPEVDPHVNPLGIKGLGELGIVGAGAAVVNAVFHATGKRLRTVPIRLEELL